MTTKHPGNEDYPRSWNMLCSYFKKKGDTVPQGSLSLENSLVKQVEHGKSEFTFSIKVQGRDGEMLLSAADQDDLEEWVIDLKEAEILSRPAAPLDPTALENVRPGR
eukprot:gene25128-30665_t